MFEDENINWKQVAIQEIKTRRACEEKLARYSKNIHQAKELLQRSSSYKGYLEQTNAKLEQHCAEREAEIQRAYQLLKKARSLIQQSQLELEVTQQQLTAKIDALQDQNIQLTQQLMQKTEALNSELELHEATQRQLKLLQRQFALEAKVNNLANTTPTTDLDPHTFENPPRNEAIVTDAALQEFFVYKPFISRV